jgi:hypothetical protein
LEPIRYVAAGIHIILAVESGVADGVVAMPVIANSIAD